MADQGEKRQARGNGDRQAVSPPVDFQRVFEAVPDPCLLLDRNLRIVAVNEEYLKATMTRREEIMGMTMMELFPVNPAEAGATGATNVGGSLTRVLERKVPDTLPLQKYDIRKPKEEGGAYEERYWSAVNTPVLNADYEVDYVIHRAHDVTDFVRRGHNILEGDAAQGEADVFRNSQRVAEANEELRLANNQLEAQREKLLELNARLEVEALQRVKAQDAADKANRELQRSNKELELFASVASHDLQEPLVTVGSYTELIAQKYRDKLEVPALHDGRRKADAVPDKRPAGLLPAQYEGEAVQPRAAWESPGKCGKEPD
ncbi:PAS domain-containing protein [Geomonas sp. RF6]|uniref:PAS domain-containing protein n=1 Tax=Geomonas sp. RF6 TaxID=2897342 RepID=UPI001E540477|nr:PAS domain-containing protein [Geomonas sp. RF6]UFS69441.1 PAS domain-containing protein [Geomonas sp. RF6]